MNDIKELHDLIEREETQTDNVTELPKIPRVDNRTVIRFIRKSGLAPGNIKVPTFVIYYHYIKWCKLSWTKAAGKEEFFRTFKRHYTQKRSGKQRYYLINDTLDLSDELYEKAEKYDARWHKNRKK